MPLIMIILNALKMPIDTTIQKANNEYKHEIEKLLTLKFQVF